MSNGEAFASRDDTTSRPEFEVALRGYDKRQVEHYVEQTEGTISTLANERDWAFSQARELTKQVQQLQTELHELRQRPARVDRASFRDLGPTVDQILALAEKQAADIVHAAGQQAADLRAEGEQTVNDAREQAAQISRDLEAELAARKAEYEQAHEERRAAAEAELAELRELNERTRSEGEAAHQRLQQEMEATRTRAHEELTELKTNLGREIEERRQLLATLQGELDSAQQRLAQCRHEEAATERQVAALQQRLEETRRELSGELNRLEEARRAAEAAEQHAKAVRAKVQREAKRVADLAAAAVIAAAQGGTETGEYPLVMQARPGNAEPPAPAESNGPAPTAHPAS